MSPVAASSNPVTRERSLDLLLVDDHPLVRAGLRHVLENDANVGTVREAANVDQALIALAMYPIQLMLLDLSLPGTDGETAVSLLRSRHPELRVVVVSARVSPPVVRRLAAAGIDGFVSKNSPPEDLRGAISSVLDGERYWCPETRACLIAADAADCDEDPFERLSDRELSIVTALLNGQRNREIARSLHLSEKTVSTYRSRSFDKLGVESVSALFRLAMRHGRWNGR